MTALYDLPVSDFNSGTFCCKLVRFVTSPTGVVDAFVMLTELDGHVYNLNLFPRELDVPAFLVVDTPRSRYVAIEGTTSLRQGAGQVSGWTRKPTPGAGGGCNPYIANARNVILSTLLSYAGGGVSSNQLFIGHSFGGAVALAMAASRAGAFGVTPKVVTFGSPRMGDLASNLFLQSCEVARWLHGGDPVPALPPNANQAPLYWALLGGPALQQSRDYVHCDGGIGIFDDITSIALIGAALTMSITEFDLAAWLLAWDEAAVSKHSLGTYLNLLAQLATKYPGDHLNAESVAETLRPRGDFPLNPMPAGEAIINSQEVSRSDIRPDQIALDPVIAPSAPRFGRLNPVFFGPQVVAYAGTKARARSLTRSLTRTLKGLAAAIVVDSDALEKAFTVAITQLQINPYEGSPPLNNLPPTTPT